MCQIGVWRLVNRDRRLPAAADAAAPTAFGPAPALRRASHKTVPR